MEGELLTLVGRARTNLRAELAELVAKYDRLGDLADMASALDPGAEHAEDLRAVAAQRSVYEAARLDSILAGLGYQPPADNNQPEPDDPEMEGACRD